ncbi:DinB family protein [Chitinophaga pendula]|uniref:DinB family protein n=1 Tax=Chitinophaga TaxID=79328 RepID=UPI000BB04F79|nr:MULTISPECIES: DinB family protein [Chitinophaga]ASZ14394.1 hypothetical protein CK934_27345 [Chitinophaga sp. MD30]UCJ07954.1 DinB family protein [Chitinophaga pendula]
MKKLLLLLPAVMLFAFRISDTRTDDREILVKNFMETRANLLKSIQGLSDKQMNFKPDSSRWSVAECLEHIILVEKGIFGMEQQLVKQTPNPEKRKDIKTKDEDLIKGVTDRSHKAKAPEFAQPKHTYATTAAAIDAFNTQRDQLIEYVKTNNDDLRNHVMDSPAGTLDAYQFLLLISSHSARHTKQIEEVKADPNFPKQ